MTFALTFLGQSVPRFPTTFASGVLLALLGAGTLGWLVAAVLGFARARAFGPAARWFALASLCMLLYHLHLIGVAVLGLFETDVDKVLSFGAFFNLFVAVGALCAILGFMRLTNPRP